MKPQPLPRRQRKLLALLRAQHKIVTSKELAAQMEDQTGEPAPEESED